MPQEMKKVNGRWVVAGSPQSSDLVPFVKPKAAAVKPVANPTPAAKPKVRPWWEKLANDISYEANQLQKGNAVNSYVRAQRNLSGLVLGMPRAAAVSVVGGADTGNRMAYEMYQRHVQKKPKADSSAGRAGEILDQQVDAAYRLLGATPPSQMTSGQRELDLMGRSAMLQLNLAALPGAGLGAPGATTALGTAVRGGAAFALNELASNYLDDNTGGNIVNLINQLSGAKLPGNVDVGNDDMVDAANKSLIPNTAAGLVLGGAVGLGASAFRNIQRRTRSGRAVQAETNERAFQENAGLIEKNEDGSYPFTQQARQPAEPAPAAPAQAAPARSPMDEFKAANAAMEEQLGMRPPAAAAPEPAPIPSIENPSTQNFGKAEAADLPEGDLDADAWDAEYDPSLPESTALGRVADELSDQELLTIANNPGLPVVERVNQTIEARRAIEAPPPMSAQMVMAPTDRLAEDYLEKLGGTLQGKEDYQLRPLFDPETNPQLWQRAQGLSGVDDPSELSKADMLDAFRSLSSEGQTPISNRLMGAQMLPTGDIKAAPLVMQYKAGVNEAGEQIGNSLEGLERWDPASEGIIQVWRDVAGEIGPAGQVYVVNGHNRLAAASRMGIPSLRVEYLDAPSAAEARRLGAVSNVSAGSGTVFDAAKLAREMGITDEAQMVAKGKPGASGFWKDGIALSRLPEDIFLAAVNEQIKVGRAVIIGKSGADEETMRSAYRYLVQQGPDNVSENRLRQMMAMATRSPAPSSAAADQPDILTGTEWEQQFNAGMLAKADLATAVEQMLKREKKLFGTVGKSGEQIKRVGQVDAAAAKEISAEASRALALFDQMKFETGPIGDLLNDNVSRVVSGQTAADVARSMKNRLVVEIKQLMGQEVAPATDAVQEDMFAAAGRGADDAQGPIELSAEERAAVKAKLLQEAISAREVRPPSTPIPELPDAPKVDAAQAALDIQANGLVPGSKAAQAMADEVRLAVEYGKADALNRWDQEEGLRDAFDYEARNFDEKKDLGVGAGYDDVMPTEVMPRQARAAAPSAKLDPNASPERTARQYGSFNNGKGKWGITEQQWLSAFKRLGGVPDWYDLVGGKANWEKLMQGQEMPELQARIKALALGTGSDDVMPTEVMPKQSSTPIADAFAAQLRGMAESDARLYRGLGESLGNIKKGLDELADPALSAAPVRPEPLQLTQAPAQPGFTLPKELSRAAPRYGRATISFASDLDRAAYTLANDAVKPSKAAPKFREAVEAAGLNVADVVAHGKRVKAAIKQAAGGGAAPQKAMELDIPAQPFGDAVKPPTKVGDVAVRQQIEANNQTMDQIRRKAQQEGC